MPIGFVYRVADAIRCACPIVDESIDAPLAIRGQRKRMTNQPPPVLRIGMIGAGWVTQHHLAAWRREASRARVVAIADPSVDRARSRSQSYGIHSVYESAAAMFASERLDAVDIATPRETHAELVRLAASHGVSALCQKPLAPTLELARALVEEVDKVAGMRLMVHENWRFRAYYRQIAQWLRGGRIGRVLQAQMTLASSGLLPNERGALPLLVRQPFMASLERALVSEILIHHLDTLRSLLGEMRVVHARIGRQSEAMSGEDHAAITLDTAEGATVQLLANLCAHGEPATLTDRLLLVGQTGTIRLDADVLVCSSAEPAHLRFDLDACYADSYAAAIGHFLDGLTSGAPFETGPLDNLRTLRLVEDVYAQAKDAR